MTEDGRVHWRLKGKATAHILVSRENVLPIPVPALDISYSGIAIPIPESSSDWPTDESLPVTISIFGNTLSSEIRVVYHNKGRVGATFNDLSANTILFLRDYLQIWQSGNQAQQITADRDAATQKKEQSFLFHGDGGMDFRIALQDGKPQGVLTFLDESDYAQIDIKGDQIKGGQAKESTSVMMPGALMEQSENSKTLGKGLFLIAGLYEAFEDARPVLDQVMLTLQSRL